MLEQKKIISIIGIIGTILLLCSFMLQQEEIILRIKVLSWGGFIGGGSSETFLVTSDMYESLFLYKDNVFNRNFAFDKIYKDSLVSLNLKKNFVIAGKSIENDKYLSSVDIGYEIVVLRTPTVCAETDYYIFIDTTQFAKSIVNKYSDSFIDISEIDNPDGWVFNKEEYHQSGQIKMKWKEKYDEKFQRVKDGLFEQRDMNGNKTSERFYKNGNHTGTWTSWDTNGKTIQTTEYYHKDTAYQKMYHYDSEQIMMQGSVIFELKEGEWEVFNIDGSLYSTITYKNNKQISVVKE